MKRKLPLPLAKKTLDDMFDGWIEVVKRKEIVLIIYPPRMDRSYRIPEFISRYERFFHFLSLDLQLYRIEDVSDWSEFITRNYMRQKIKPTVFLIRDAEELLLERRQLLSAIADFYIKEQVPLLLFSKSYPYAKLPPVLTQNFIFQPLYGRDDIESFIDYLEIKFVTSLKRVLREKINERTGGSLWLVKEIVRYLATRKPGDPFDHEELWWRVARTYEGFHEREKTVLQQIVQGQTPADEEALLYLEKTRVIRDGKLTIGLSSDFINNKLLQKVKLSLRNSEFYIADVPVGHFLSEFEKRGLKVLLEKGSVLVKRDQLAHAWWGEAEYTDWSLDQAVKRLRQKLIKFGLPQNYIRTVKGKGYYVAG